MENCSGLEEAPYFGSDLMYSAHFGDCSFYKQVKFRPAESDEQKADLDSDALLNGAYRLACDFPRKGNDKFAIFLLNSQVFDRFVELLASLNLYYFSLASKELYYRCLDIRGLDCKAIWMPSAETDCSFDGYSGMRTINVLERCSKVYVLKYAICNMSLLTDFRVYAFDPTIFSFVKNYKELLIAFSNCPLLETLFEKFCEEVFHPHLDHVLILFYTYKDATGYTSYLSFGQFKHILSLCTNVETFSYKTLGHVFWTGSDPPLPRYINLNGNPKFVRIKQAVDAWAATTTRLKTFTLVYKHYYFQVHDKVLKRMVFYQNKWYWSDQWDIDNNNYRVYRLDNTEREKKYPLHVFHGHYEDMMDALHRISAKLYKVS